MHTAAPANGDGPGVRLRKHEADRAHALEKAEQAVDRHLAEVDAPAQVKAVAIGS